MKTSVVVIYGGRSTEHNISCRSAAFVLANLNTEKYDVHALAIDKDGQWIPQQPERLLAAVREKSIKVLPIESSSEDSIKTSPLNPSLALAAKASDQKVVFFPVLHGTYGEDGSIQGLFELLCDSAYVGPGVLGSSMAVDKVIAKQRAESVGIKVVPYLAIRHGKWQQDGDFFVDECIAKLGSDLVVKPATLGSSVGITIVSGAKELKAACELAFEFDRKILIEKKMVMREIECAALGEWEPEISLPGEVVSDGGFYSYNAKYIDPNAATIAVPAKLSDSLTAEVRQLSSQAFQALELYGMARLDWFLEGDQFYFNEANTIPGFTEISQYPQLWKHSGIDSQTLIDRLIELAWKRHSEISRLQRNIKA
ncbi:D-alanine--D-alanine ligase [Oligoflexaceae bacterium]|nr:D-alanine--D-alanine ligase [Oligoflexaceae bacterium]